MLENNKFDFDIENIKKDLAIENMYVNDADIDMLKRVYNNEITMEDVITNIKQNI